MLQRSERGTPANGMINMAVLRNLPYAAIHQFGFSGNMEIKAHTKIVSHKILKSGKKVSITNKIANRKRAPRGASQQKSNVTGHSRKVDIPARPFLVLQNEDLEEIMVLMKDFFNKEFST